MKKTLLVFSLVVLFSLIMATGVFAAEITLNEENPVLDLTGKNIEGPIVVENGNVTIKGNGTVTSSTGSAIIVRGGNVTINGGTFVSDSTEVYNQAALYVDANGTVTINAGTFTGNKYNYAVRVHAGTLTVNGGTIHADNAASVACCGGTLNVNGGTWSSDGEWTVDGVTQSDILAACAMNSGVQANVVVKGGTFVDFDPTKIYYSTGFEDSVVESTGTALAEGYVYDTETGKVACAHSDLEEHKAVAATYEKEGSKAYWVCEECGKWFEDEAATKEITDENSIVIPKLVKVEEEEKPSTGEGPTEQEPEEEKDITPETGSVDVVLFASAIVAVISVAGIVLVKKYTR